MINSFGEKILFIFRSLNAKEILDILILTLIVYFFLLFFLRKRFLRVFFAFFLFFLLYFISSTLSLTISKTFFQYFFNLGVIFLLIIFQKEIRSWFEFLGEWRPRTILAKREFIVDEISKAIFKFSKEKIGALLVFENLVPLETQLYHKVPLNSEINSQILESIFQKNSPLHDGAVLIQKSKIKYACCHLPLSESAQTASKGTRHRAALGIVEKSDALSLVVSEQTGEISLAKDGKIYFNVSPEILREELLKYYQLKPTGLLPKKGYFPQILKNIFIFFLSLLVSFSIFIFYSLSSGYVVKEVKVPLEFKNLSPTLELKEVSPSTISVTLFEKKERLATLNESKLKFVVDLKDYQKEGWFFINLKTENFSEKDLNIKKINPSKIKILLKSKEI